MFKYSADTTPNAGMPIWYKDAEETLHKSLGRELVENLVKQSVVLYRIDEVNTVSDFYGESKTKTYMSAVTLYGRVQISDADVVLEGGIRRLSKGDMIFSVYDDHLTESGVEINVGDFIGFQGKYYEVFDPGYNKDSNERRLGVTREFYRTILAHVVHYDIFSGA